MSLVYETLEKRAAWVRVYKMDFKDFAEVKAGETLLAAVVSGSPSGLTLGSASVSGSLVSFLISGGTVGTTYTLTVSVTTTADHTLTGTGYLAVS